MSAASPMALSWEHAQPLALAGGPRRLIPLVLGYEPIAEATSLAGGGTFRYLLEPVTAAAVVFDRGWVLVDGGFDPTRVADADSRRIHFDYRNYTPIVPGEDPLREQVAAAGLDWNDLAAAILTHAHFDHTGAARMLRRDQPLVMQRREWEHVMSLTDPRGAFVIREDFAHPNLLIALVDGDTQLAPGLSVIDTAGHTPGHQSVVVELPDATVVLAGDAADLRRNIDGAIACGSTVGTTGPRLAQRSIERLQALDRGEDTTVWPAHDPLWPAWQGVIDALDEPRPPRD